MGLWRWAVGLSLLGVVPQVSHNIIWSPGSVGQLRFLYAHMRTEFAGCLFGNKEHDTVYVAFFITSNADPRLASDSGVRQGTCPDVHTVKGNHLVGLAHSHVRVGSMCYPSDRDRATLQGWMKRGAIFGAIMCAHGDTIAVFSPDAYGLLAIPPLDSLYQP